jgi:hypothetical protein
MGRAEDLHEDVLGNVLGLCGVAEHPIDQVQDRLLVLVHQIGKSSAIALFDAQHQGGIGFQLSRHGLSSVSYTAKPTRFDRAQGGRAIDKIGRRACAPA